MGLTSKCVIINMQSRDSKFFWNAILSNDILYNSILLLHTAEITRITNKLQISNKFDFIYNSILVYDDKIAFQKNWLSLLCILMITHFEVSSMQYIKIIRQKQLTILTYLHKTKLIPLHNNFVWYFSSQTLFKYSSLQYLILSVRDEGHSRNALCARIWYLRFII
jgi:hypothetical protein